MTIVFRTAGAWGPGQGADLTAPQVDENFYELLTRVADLESVPAGVGIDYISVSGASFTVHLTDHSIEGPFPLPVANWTFRGEWTASTPYVINDVFQFGGSLYIVIFAHTSAATFDPNANDGLGHDYYLLVLTPYAILPVGGDASQVLTKHSGADFDVFWANSGVAASLPAGGTAGQALLKHSGADYDTVWADNIAGNGLPAGGTAAQILAKLSSTDYAAAWVDSPVGLPAGGLTAQVLSKHSGADYDAEWTTPDEVATTWYSANGAPTTLFNDGDFYLDAITGNVYKQIASVWVLQLNIKGPAGAAGSNGTNGLNGSTWYSGNGAPSTTHADGDFYIDFLTGDYYRQTSGAWGSPVGNITPALPTGGTTGQVLTKNSGTNFDASWQTPSGGGGSEFWPPINGAPTAPPTIASWTSFGSGVTAEDFTAGSTAGVRVRATTTGSGNIIGIYKTQSFGSNFTITAGFRIRPFMLPNNGGGGVINGAGLLFMEASATSGVFFGQYTKAGIGRIKFTTLTTVSEGAAAYSDLNGGSPSNAAWLAVPLEFYIRAVWNQGAGTLTFSWSADGNYWSFAQSYNPGSTDSFTFTRIGLAMNTDGGGFGGVERSLDCAHLNIA